MRRACQQTEKAEVRVRLRRDQSARRDQVVEPEPEPLFDPAWAVPPTFSIARDVIAPFAHDLDRVALTAVGADGTVDRRTYVDLAHLAGQWARLIRGRVSQGGRVALALDLGSSFATALLGAERVGVLPVVLESGLAVDELERRLRHTEPELVLCEESDLAAFSEAAARCDSEIAVITVADAEWELMRVGEPTEYAAPAVDAPGLVVYSRGGSSGVARPILHAHASAFAAYLPAQEWLGVKGDDTVYCAFEGATAAAIWDGFFGTWHAGANVLVIHPSVPPHERAVLLDRYEPTLALGTPDELAHLIELCEHSGLELTKLRRACATGSPLTPEFAEAFQDAVGSPVLNGYSTAETGTIAFQMAEDDSPSGSLGRPAPGQIVAPVDREGHVSPVGVVGDLAIYGRPPSLFTAEFSPAEPDALARPIDWWTLTGDRAAVDENGHLWLVSASVEVPEPDAVHAFDEEGPADPHTRDQARERPRTTPTAAADDGDG